MKEAEMSCVFRGLDTLAARTNWSQSCGGGTKTLHLNTQHARPTDRGEEAGGSKGNDSFLLRGKKLMSDRRKKFKGRADRSFETSLKEASHHHKKRKG